jgi:hypothetical protein
MEVRGEGFTNYYGSVIRRGKTAASSKDSHVRSTARNAGCASSLRPNLTDAKNFR